MTARGCRTGRAEAVVQEELEGDLSDDLQLGKHDRKLAWWAITSRAEQAANRWWHPAVIEEVRRAVASDEFDGLLNPAAVERWNDLSQALITKVTDALSASRPAAEELVREYVQLNVSDCLYLPSGAAMSTFVQTSLTFQQSRGYQRDIARQRFGVETFHPAQGSNDPRIVLHDTLGQTLIEFVNFWPDRPGFIALLAVLDSANTVIVLDVPARERQFMDAEFLHDCGVLASSWRQLLEEHKADLYQSQMRHSHDGLENFPEADPAPR